MNEENAQLRSIAHSALCLREAPYLKHYNRGRFEVWREIALTGSDLPGPGFNFVAVLGSSPKLNEIIPFAKVFFADAIQGWGILVEGDAGQPIEKELQALGWPIAEDEPAFVLENIHSIERPTSLPRDFIIERVRNPSDEVRYHNLLAKAFAAPPEFAAMMIPVKPFLLNRDIGMWIGSFEGSDVCGIGLARVGETAILSGLGTLEAYRGRGFGSLLSRTMLAEAASEGCQDSVLRSGPKSIPLYERIGYRNVCQHRTYTYPGEV